MVRRAARTDENQAEIVRALRGIGCSVQDLSAVGKGCPDLLVGRGGRNWLMEVKRPAGPRGGMRDRGLTPDQVKWHDAWSGHVCVVTTAEDAVRVVLA